MSERELYALACEVMESHPGCTDIDKLAMLVAEATPEECLYDFYVGLLPRFLRVVSGRKLRRNFGNGGGADAVEEIEAPRPAARPGGRSSKIAERQSWWQRLLSQRVGLPGGVLKALGDCDVDDLNACIAERRKQIAGFEKQVGNYEHLVFLLVKHGRRRVQDLPEQTEWPV